MTTRAAALTVLVGLTLMGCAGRSWVKPGSTAQEGRIATYECERDMRMGHFGGGLVGAVEQGSFYSRCMEARGWTLITNSPAAATTSSPITDDPTYASRWDSAVFACRAKAKVESKDAQEFVNMHDRCMKSAGF